MANKVHNFGEEAGVWQTPSFIASRDKAIEMIESGKYGLNDSDFWILKTRTRNGKLAYKSLIISHNGCLKINSKLPENKQFKSIHLGKPERSLFGNSVILEYDDGDLREYGEVSSSNCKSEYPMATLLKRVMDRVILKKSELAYSGIFSEVEAEEFKQSENEIEDAPVVVSTATNVEKNTYSVDAETGEVTSTAKTVQVQVTKPQSEHERLIDTIQISKVKSLYTASEIKSMLGRMKLTSINDVTAAQAEKMISARAA